MVSQALLRSTARRLQRIPINKHLTAVTTTCQWKSTAAATANDQHESESFLTGTSSLYAEQMYENYSVDRMSVHQTWRQYFDDLESGNKFQEGNFNRPTVVTSNKKVAATTAADSHLAVSLFFKFIRSILFLTKKTLINNT